MKPDERLGIERENSMTPDERFVKLELRVAIICYFLYEMI